MPHARKDKLIDRLLAEGWFATAGEALPWIIAGKVLVGDQRAYSAAEIAPANAEIRIKEYYKTKYVNKGGLKLEKALAEFNASCGVDVCGKVALDCGASTGGFTDCLLRHGAGRVYAVDAGHGELAGKLLINDKVVNMERTNISDARLKSLALKPEIVTLDLSYLSLRLAVPICRDILAPGGTIIALIKPIVEVESSKIKRSGDVNRREVIAEVLRNLCGVFIAEGFDIAGLTYSPVRGNNGALEYFACLRPRTAVAEIAANESLKSKINEIIEQSFLLNKFSKTRIQL